MKSADGDGRRAAGAATSRAEVSAPTRDSDGDGRPRPSGRRAALTVRQAAPADLPTVISLRLSLLREHGRHPIYGRLRADAAHRARELFAAQLDSSSEVMFLAERGSQVVGILRCVESTGSPLLHPARYGYVSSVFVTANARRGGVLRALLAHAVRWCEERGLAEMRLHSVAGDAVSEAAWDALGFEVVEYVRLKKIGV